MNISVDGNKKSFVRENIKKTEAAEKQNTRKNNDFLKTKANYCYFCIIVITQTIYEVSTKSYDV